MTHFTGDYYVFEDELYRKVKMTPKGYHLKDKKGKLQWITIKKIKDILDQRKKKWYNKYGKPNDHRGVEGGNYGK